MCKCYSELRKNVPHVSCHLLAVETEVCYVHCWCVHNTLQFLQCLALPAKLMMMWYHNLPSMEDVIRVAQTLFCGIIIMKDPVPKAIHNSNAAITNTMTSVFTVHTYTFLKPFCTASATCKCPLLLESTEVGLSNHHQLRRSKHIPFNAIKCRCDTIDVTVLAMASNVRLHLS